MTREVIVRLRGGSYQNSDGAQRQFLISKCKNGDKLLLRAEPDNPYDRHTVAVFNTAEEKLGYLPSDARDSSSLLRGEKITATIFKKIGGTKWWHKLFGIKRHYGLLIKLQKHPIDWNEHNAHREKATIVDNLVKEALQCEKSEAPTEEKIKSFRVAMAAIIDINKENPIAAAHRFEQAPINRFTMFLVKNKLQSEAKKEFDNWKGSNDPIGLSKVDKEALEKRISKISAI